MSLVAGMILLTMLSFVLGLFTMGIVQVHREYSAFEAGYMEASDGDVSNRSLSIEAMHAYQQMKNRQL